MQLSLLHGIVDVGRPDVDLQYIRQIRLNGPVTMLNEGFFTHQVKSDLLSRRTEVISF